MTYGIITMWYRSVWLWLRSLVAAATFVATSVLAVEMAGCAAASKEPASEVVIAPPPPPPEPAMPVSADAQLTLFGELPDRARVPFQARAASAAKQHTFTTEGSDFDVQASPDGKWLLFCSTRHSTRPDIYLKTIDGSAVTQIVSDPAADVQPTFSPDGKQIAFASDRAGNWDIYIMSLDGGLPTQVTHSPQHEVHPSFSPDGKRLVYCTFNDRAGDWELWTLQLDQAGSRRMIGLGLFPEWSPKSDSIVYQRARQRGGRWFSIWRVDLAAGEPKFPVELLSSAQMAYIQPTWSRDGEYVACGSAQPSAGTDLPGQLAAQSARGDVWVMRADGSGSVQVTDGASPCFGPAWSSDGRVYFSSLASGSENLWSLQPGLAGLKQGSIATDDKPASPADERAAVPKKIPPQGG